MMHTPPLFDTVAAAFATQKVTAHVARAWALSDGVAFQVETRCGLRGKVWPVEAWLLERWNVNRVEFTSNLSGGVLTVRRVNQ